MKSSDSQGSHSSPGHPPPQPQEATPVTGSSRALPQDSASSSKALLSLLLLPSSNCTLKKKERKETSAMAELCPCPQARPVTSLTPEPCSPWAPESGGYLSHPHCHTQDLALREDSTTPSLVLFLFHPGPAPWSHSLGVAEGLDCPLPASESPDPGNRTTPLLSFPCNPAANQENPY